MRIARTNTVFVDSGPVLEKALARNAGLGWIGKHTNLIARDAGSWFFIGEILTDLPLTADTPATAHCGSCSACMPACPTQAIIAPYQLDARRCISYLTIELKGSIPMELRPQIGNRIYGCDDCQLVCPGTIRQGAAIRISACVSSSTHRIFRTPRLDTAAVRAAIRSSAVRRIGHSNSCECRRCVGNGRQRRRRSRRSMRDATIGPAGRRQWTGADALREPRADVERRALPSRPRKDTTSMLCASGQQRVRIAH